MGQTYANNTETSETLLYLVGLQREQDTSFAEAAVERRAYSVEKDTLPTNKIIQLIAAIELPNRAVLAGNFVTPAVRQASNLWLFNSSRYL